MIPKENKFKYAVKYIIKAGIENKRDEINETILSSNILCETKYDISRIIDVRAELILDFQSVTTFKEYLNYRAKINVEKTVAHNTAKDAMAENNGFIDKRLIDEEHRTALELTDAINEYHKFVAYASKGGFHPDDTFYDYEEN
ncbi:hypothetical protein [Aurantibacillus circumpalustris]|uniref:hypothetical protein n=1 Tax=Aurantibacillus circumpalustris TaxID=3036359 RepID=UPI00295B960C|nr:hypothetical protein [Aurantibacillus circumpalustris]